MFLHKQILSTFSLSFTCTAFVETESESDETDVEATDDEESTSDEVEVADP